MLKRFVFLMFVAAVLGPGAHCANAQKRTYERAPINYDDTPVHDAVAKLNARLADGKAKLAFDNEHGYLASVLRELDIPVSSQTLVFSKTSMQLHAISPRMPRAIYFNDDVYVGWCKLGKVLEFATTDANQGAIFYTLNQTEKESPQFTRDRGTCLVCHSNHRTQNVPGYFVRSVFPQASGHPALGSGTYTTDSSSPFDERWGGWYVTGKHGRMRHMGNAILPSDALDLDREPGANQTKLDGFFATHRYLSPHSDLVALMVLEHQTQMHNAIASANYETREALHQSFEMNKLLERDADHISESAQRRMNAAAENVVDHLLMVDEFALQDTVEGTSDFAAEFQNRGPRDSKNRSLRQLDLQTRLFRYPCSYLIYNPAVDALPPKVHRLVVEKLMDVLEGRDESESYAHLTPSMKQEILEILRETKPGLFAGDSARSNL
ncbi:MAG: hypothetical protein HKN47_12560 [Pirellulaceae bacterium]|nr:hypothetical protein [Pirellulaceae bacterium]